MKNSELLKQKNPNISLFINCLLAVIIPVFMVVQNSSFLFNPFLLIVLSSAYVISFSTFLISSGSMILAGFLINKVYGFEILFLIIIYLIFHFGCRVLKNKNLKLYSPMVLTNIIVFIIYFLTTNDAFYRINSLVLCFISILLSFNVINIISKYKNKEEVNVISLGLLIGMVTILFASIEQIAFLFAIIVLFIVLRMERQELYIISTFVSFIFFYYYSNNSINVLIAIYTSLLIVGLLLFKYNYFIFVPLISLFFLSINLEFYRDITYIQIIIGYLLMCLIPNKFLSDLREKINYLPRDSLKEIVNYQNYKFAEISKLCDLLLDDRFDKYEKIEKQLEKMIKKDVCNKCGNKGKCKLDLSKFLTGHISNNDKKEIEEKCIYPIQITKSLEDINVRVMDYSERELKSIESRKIMNNAYQIIKDYIDLRPINKKTKKNYDYESFVISNHAKNSPNGDAYRFYEDEYHNLFMLSDGMGHTSKSRDISQYLIELTNYLFLISNDPKKAINSVNQILLAKTYEEVYATLDMCQLDLEKGILKLYKAGSFPTIVIRNKCVKEISTKLPPIGIINGINIEEEEVELKHNDIILFMTDGFGENVIEIVKKTIQKATFLPLDKYLKFLQEALNENLKIEDDQTLVGIKIYKS